MSKGNKANYNYSILFKGSGDIVNTFYITTEINLLDHYKSTLAAGTGYVSWEKGVIDVSNVVGIIEV